MYFELLTTIILGTLGVLLINAGSRAYLHKNFKRGSTYLLLGNNCLTLLTAINEYALVGYLGPYTLAQIPFTLAGFAQYFIHHHFHWPFHSYSFFVWLSKKYNHVASLTINLAIFAYLLVTGMLRFSEPLGIIQQIGFMLLSTSFILPLNQKGMVFKKLQAEVERYSLTFFARVMLVFVLTVNMSYELFYIYNGKSVLYINLIVLAWFILNLLAFKQDFANWKTHVFVKEKD